MKAIVNIGLRKVELIYTIKTKDLTKLSHKEMVETFGEDWELEYNDKNTKIKCKHTIWFDDFDEWKSVLLFDDRMIDFHYDYEDRNEFKTKKDWGGYLFQGYEYTDGQPQMYDKNVVTQVVVIF
jgi:hypothetical protein